MNLTKAIAALVIVHGGLCASLYAQPANDSFANRTLLTGKSVLATGNNDTATAEPDEPIHVGIAAGKSVWWSWTAPQAGAVTVNTAGSTFDTLLAVYTGTSVSNLLPIASNDDAPDVFGTTSELTFFATAGATYQIAVDGYPDGGGGFASGDITLRVGLASSQFHLNSISFSERWADAVVAVTQDGDTFHELRSRDTVSARAVITIPGLQNISAADWAGAFVHLSLGNLSFDDSLGTANAISATRAVFNVTTENSAGDTIKVGQFIFTRSGNILTITFDATHPENSIAAYNYYDQEGPIADATSFEFSFNDLELERNVYFTGTNNITTKVFPGDFGDETFQANTIRISGRGDFRPPSVALVSPAPGARLTNETVTVDVRAIDRHEVEDVRFSLNGGDFESGLYSDVNLWSIDLDLIPGTNVIRYVALDVDGNMTNRMFKVVYVLMSPVRVEINGDGTVSGVSDGQMLEVGKTYTVTGTPAPGCLVSSLYASDGTLVTGSSDITAPVRFTFRMAENLFLYASFINNPFIESKGTYLGLFAPPNPDPAIARNSGAFTLRTTDKGAYTGAIQISGQSFPFSGRFSAFGYSSKVVNRQGLPPLLLYMNMDFPNNSLSGGVLNTQSPTQANLFASRVMYSATNPAPQMGNYTMLIFGSDDSATQPGGDGFGAAKVSTNGTITFKGRLGDGTAVTHASAVSGPGQWPFYIPVYGGKGVILGWLNFTNDVDRDIDGSVRWTKPPMPGANTYPAGFTNETEVAGSIYQFTNGVPVLNFSTGQVWLAQGTVPPGFTNQFLLDTNSKVLNLSSNALSLTITNSSGLFRGSIVDPLNGQSIVIQGAVHQKMNIGSGFFTETNITGHVQIGPQ